MARLAGLRVFPVKALDGIDVEEVEILDGGTVAHDREFALFDDDGEVINGKRTARVHDVRTDFDTESGELAVAPADGESRRFALEDDRERAARWFSEQFGCPVTVRRDTSRGFVDRREMGPSIVSTATLRTVASWFDGLTVEGLRRRLRTNVEVGGVEPFWEDRLVGEGAPAVSVGGVRLEGVTPCGRCVVPERDPDTGEPTPEFRSRFVRNRRESFPEWADEGAFDHFYTVTVIARVPEADRGRTLRVGDPVELVG